MRVWGNINPLFDRGPSLVLSHVRRT